MKYIAVHTASPGPLVDVECMLNCILVPVSLSSKGLVQETAVIYIGC